MKKVKIILLIAGILVAGCAFTAVAQKNKAEKTASAKAYYGQKPQKPNFKKKQKQKVDWSRHTKPAKGTTRAEGRHIRKKKYSS
jgi:hypothetical protein